MIHKYELREMHSDSQTLSGIAMCAGYDDMKNSAAHIAQFLLELQRMLPRLQVMLGIAPSDSPVSADEVGAFIASIK